MSEKFDAAFAKGDADNSGGISKFIYEYFVSETVHKLNIENQSSCLVIISNLKFCYSK